MTLPSLSMKMETILNPHEWRQRYAWGHIVARIFDVAPDATVGEINALMKATVGGLPDHVVQWHLAWALSELGAKLYAPLSVEIVKTVPVDDDLVQGTDYHRTRDPLPMIQSNARDNCRIDIGEPIISIQRVRLSYYGSIVQTLDSAAQLETVRIVNRKAGTIHIMPSTFDIGLATAVNRPLPYVAALHQGSWSRQYQQRTTLPATWLIDYTTGPTDGFGAPGTLPAALAHYVWARAGLIMYSLSGIAQGGGVASGSVSIDGVSHSIGTTASAMYGLNSAYEKVLQDEVKALDLDFWRRHMSGVQAVVF